jgi:deazaflavin-dependent oxidoreductase (nitroreductase family)
MPIGNAIVSGVLRSPLRRMLSRSLMLLKYKGRRTGKEYTIPVGYVRHGDEIIVLAGRADAKSWWRSMRGPLPVQVRLGRAWKTGVARAVEGEDAVPRMKAYLEAQPRMAKMLRVERDAEGLIPLEQARRALEGNVVVVIDVGESGAPGL